MSTKSVSCSANSNFLLVLKFLLVRMQLLQPFDLVVIVVILFILLQFRVLLHALHKVDVGTGSVSGDFFLVEGVTLKISRD